MARWLRELFTLTPADARAHAAWWAHLAALAAAAPPGAPPRRAG